MIRYEWIVETMDGKDVQDVTHFDTFAEALASYSLGMEIALVRDVIASDENLQDRQWAYMGNGRLPEVFDRGTRVPKRFKKEVSRAEFSVTCVA